MTMNSNVFVKKWWENKLIFQKSIIWFTYLSVSRHCVRRHSSRFRHQVRELEEKLFEIEDIKLVASEEEEERKNNISSSSSLRFEEASALQTTSIKRPLFRAAQKIQSYKQSHHNIKIRRQEWENEIIIIYCCSSISLTYMYFFYIISSMVCCLWCLCIILNVGKSNFCCKFAFMYVFVITSILEYFCVMNVGKDINLCTER